MMTAPSRENSELMDLLSRAWDGRLDEQARARIEQLLSRDTQAGLKLLISYTRLHLDLEWLISSDAAQEKAVESLKRAGFVGENEPRWKRWHGVGLCGLAAAILVMVLSIWSISPTGHARLTRAPQPIGSVVRLENAVWVGGEGPQLGDAVQDGQDLDLQQGYAQISMGFGADLLLEGPCRTRLLSNNRVALEQGNLAVRAAKWAIGFKVETDDLVATDLGTWFSMRSTREGQSEIHVLEGSVLAEPRNAKSPSRSAQQLKADEAVHMTRDGAFQATTFRRDAVAEQLTQFQPLHPIQIWNTGVGLGVGDDDPHWKVRAGNSPIGAFPQSAIVSAPHGSYGINEPERSQWISVYAGTTKGVPARSQYTFETTFDLTGFDLNSVWVSGLVLADDGVDEVWLNGERLSIDAWRDWAYGVTYVKFHPIEIRSGFVPDINHLAIVVKNETFIYRSKKGFDLPETPNPMALRVEWQAFGRLLGGGNGG